MRENMFGLSTGYKKKGLAFTSLAAIVVVGVGGYGSIVASASNKTSHSSSSNELAAIQKAGVITIGVAQDPPFEFTNSSGKWTSFDPILDQKLATYLHVKVQFVSTGWTGIVAGLQTGRYDIIGADINATAARRKVIAFTDPYYQTGTSFFALPSNAKKLDSIAALNSSNVTVAVVTGSDNQTAVTKYLPKATMRALPNASVASLVSEVVSHRSDVLATSTYLAPALVANYHFTVLPSLATAPNGVLPVGVAWGVPKGQHQLLAKMNSFLKAETKNGDIAKLQKKWLTAQNSLK
jgi:ABC-type amino acid transport substrate-binding protein